MKATTKVVNFDFEFQFSLRGQFAMETAICLAEPAYDKQTVFHQMRAFMSEVSRASIEWTAKKKSLAGENAESEETTAAEPDEETKAKIAEEQRKAEEDGTFDLLLLNQIRLCLPAERYIQFVEYVQKSLMAAPTLAWVGGSPEQPFQERAALNPEVWKSIGMNGGMDAIERVIAGFASFFFRDRTSKTTSLTTENPVGSDSSFAPLATATEASPTSRRQRGGR